MLFKIKYQKRMVLLGLAGCYSLNVFPNIFYDHFVFSKSSSSLLLHHLFFFTSSCIFLKSSALCLCWICGKVLISFISFFRQYVLSSSCSPLHLLFGPRQANLVLIAYASSEGSGEPAHPRSLARTFAVRSYKQ